MIKNVPYMRKLSKSVIRELIYLMRQSKYDAGSVLLKRGDIAEQVFMIKEGVVKVEVPYKNEDIFFDYLSPGSCFGCYSALTDDMPQILSFKAETPVVIEAISTADLRSMADKFLALRDELKILDLEIEAGQKTDFDFFRYRNNKVKLT